MRRLVLCLLGSLLAASAEADSEGYFCHSSEYLAYETRWGEGFPDVPGGHRLHVLRFGGAGELGETVSVRLPDFQTHGMRCEGRAVSLLAHPGVHRVELGRDARPVYAGASPIPAECLEGERLSLHLEGCELAFPPASNLGRLAEPGVHVLRSREEGGRVELVVETAASSAPGAVHHLHHSALVKRDLDGEETARRELFAGASLETVD